MEACRDGRKGVELARVVSCECKCNGHLVIFREPKLLHLLMKMSKLRCVIEFRYSSFTLTVQLLSAHQEAVDTFNAQLAERTSAMEAIQSEQSVQLQQAEDSLRREKISRYCRLIPMCVD